VVREVAVVTPTPAVWLVAVGYYHIGFVELKGFHFDILELDEGGQVAALFSLVIHHRELVDKFDSTNHHSANILWHWNALVPGYRHWWIFVFKYSSTLTATCQEVKCKVL